MKKIGLALAGGGSLGSYQIGVWKALKEYGIDKRISVMSGTSVGILNACLMIQNDYELAEFIWKNEIYNKILSKQNFQRKYKYISYNGIFSREGLLELIEKYVDINLVSNYKFPVYATAVNLKKIDVEYFKLNGRTSEEIKEIMMASSAVPFVFGREKINGVDYVDGGVEILNGRNLPLKPLYDEGCEQIIAINIYKKTVIEKSENCKVYEIIPSKDIGTFIKDGIDFSSSNTIMRIEEGYKDAINILKPIFKMGRIQIDSLNLNKQMYKNELKNNSRKKSSKSRLNKAISDLKINY